MAKNIAKKTQTDVHISKVDISFFSKIILEDVYLSDKQKDTLFYSKELVASIDSIKLFQHRIHLKSIVFDQPSVYLSKLDSNTYNFSFLQNIFIQPKSSSSSDWKYFCNKFELKGGNLSYTDPHLNPKWKGLSNLSHLDLVLDSLKLIGSRNFNCKIEKLNFTNADGFKVKSFKTAVSYKDSVLNIDNIAGSTSNSQAAIRHLQLNLADVLKTNNIKALTIDALVDELDFGMRDLVYFIGDEYNKNLHAKLAGHFSGNLDNFRGKGMQLSVENFTHLNGDFYINDLAELKTAYLFFDLNESYANLNEIRNLQLPSKIQQVIDQLPSFLNNVGTFTYKGNFTGFIDDFVAYGTVYSNLGSISSDISFKPVKNEQLQVNGHVSTINLDVGKIFANTKLDKLTLSGEINGTVNYDSQYELQFDGKVDSVDINQYKYHQIDLTGTIQNKRFNGSFSILDPNVMMSYSGELDLSPELPVFEFVAQVDYANLHELNLVDDENAEMRMTVDANFIGNNIDNVQGHLALSDIYYRNSIDEFAMDELVVDNISRSDISLFTIKSDAIDGEINGHYNLMNIANSLVAYYRKYLPSSYVVEIPKFNEVNEFQYSFNIKDPLAITKLFIPDLYMDSNFKIEGFYKPNKDSVLFETTLPFLQYKNKKLENVRLLVESNANNLFAKAKLDKVSLNDKLNIYNITVESSGKNDSLLLDVFWNNFAENTYSGKLKTSTLFSRTKSAYPNIKMKVEPSTIYFSDSIWTIDQTEINIDSSSISIHELNFHHNEQRFLVDGKIAKTGFDQIFTKIENVNMTLFEPLMGKSLFAGKINGSASLADAYTKMKLNLNLRIDDLAFNEGYLGELTMNSMWDNDDELLASEVKLINNDRTIFEATGNVDPVKKALDMQLNFDHSPISFLEAILPSTFNKEGGEVNGSVRVYGDFLHIMHDGKLTPVNQASFGLAYLNTVYYTSDPVEFSKDSIVFNNMRFTDDKGNNGIFNGSLKHKTFGSMEYNMSVTTDNIMALNTTAADNDYLYGTAFVSGSLYITGKGADILLTGNNLATRKGTVINIPFDNEESAEQYDFIEFVNNVVEDEKNEYRVVTSGIDMNFDLDITPDAKVQIIFNTRFGEVIKGTGSGNLQIKVDRNYNILLYGNYEIEEGDYLFTVQNLLNKRFSIEKGSTMEWVGDPYEALINIKAVYKLKTSLYDLFVGSYDDVDLTRRIPVDCIINLTDNLMTPKVDFDIELPTADERIKDDVGQLIVTEEDVSKQIISLMMLGHFYTPEFVSGKPISNNSSDLFGTTASELLSNQLSNWLSKISDYFDIGIKYRPGNEISENQVELALSTQILNNRVSFDGNVANNANPNSSNGAIVGDFDVMVKLTENGKLQLKAYNHSNDNIIYDTSPYTQGIGFSYFEDFNSFADLRRRYKNMFSKKKKKTNANEAKNE